MAWDFVESNPMGGSSGGLWRSWVCMALETILLRGPDSRGRVMFQCVITPAFSCRRIRRTMTTLDRLRLIRLLDVCGCGVRCVHHPGRLSTVLVPKAEGCGKSRRHGGRDEAAAFFERGFENVFTRARASTDGRLPTTVYYAFSSRLTRNRERRLYRLVVAGRNDSAGWTIMATWPIRSELGNRMIASGRQPPRRHRSFSPCVPSLRRRRQVGEDSWRR